MKNQEINDQKDFNRLHHSRSYRHRFKSQDLVSFQVKQGPSDLWIQASRLLEDKAHLSLSCIRRILQDYIKENPVFETTLNPYPRDPLADPVVKEMIEVSACCGVGPMAAVAGCIAQYVAQSLLNDTDEILVENGGDLYLKSARTRRVIIYAGSSALSNRITLKINSSQQGVGICTSSGTVGPSFSMGKADAVTVLSHCAALADAAATALGNIIQTKEDITRALEMAQKITGIIGVVMIKDDKIGLWGDIDYGVI